MGHGHIYGLRQETQSKLVKHRIIPTKPIDDGFDRQNLSIINKRFTAVNEDRLARMRGALAERHQVFLDALPLLFHCNHPMLPGFVSRQTPCKVSRYKPSKADINSGKSLARSFTLNYEPDIQEEIYGIYVMGSVGTIAQSERSDLDIWLCHKPGLSAEKLKDLQLKCDRISTWAEQQRLEAHFFLMDYEQFKHGHISTLDQESSGSAQRLLLLDEFYRSAIFIAGRIPLWWYIPENCETQYEEHATELLHKRFIAPDHVLDFGGVSHIPGGEFIGAGIWQLYKAIESPYKSVLKLLLLEVYVSEYPNIRPLALSYKQCIFDGEIDIDKLDSYVMVYKRIEDYLLAQGHHKRLELARRCFYFKVGRALSRSSTRSTRPWQRDLLLNFVEQWQWTDAGLKLLDSRKSWKVGTVASERALLVNELNHSYQFLLEFAQAQGLQRSISVEELTVLGRKLQAAFERRPGKIEWVNPNISKDLSEDILMITRDSDNENATAIWTAHAINGPATSRQSDTIRSSTSFVELLLWCYYNGIIEPHTTIDLSHVSIIGNKEVRKLIHIFDHKLPKPNKSVPHDNFYHSAKPERVLLLLNVGSAPSPELSHQGLQRLTENSDALSYGGHEENLVASVDLISINSWHEVHLRRFERESALLDALKEYLQLSLPGTHHATPKLHIECIGSDYAGIIEHRVNEWLNEIIECFYTPNTTKKRYLFTLSEQLHRLQFKGMRPVITAFDNEKDLINSLADSQTEFNGIAVDSRCLRTSPIAFIASKIRRNTISIFYRRFDIGMETFIADERGSISHTIIRGQRKHNPLKPLHRFLRAVINRQARSQPELLADFGICPVYFYELHRKPGQLISGRQTPISQQSHQTNMFEIKAIAYSDDNEHVHYDFYCDDQEFSSRSFQDQLFLVVAQFVLSRRIHGENYPIYMTDLDLSLCANILAKDGNLQITHYLNIKNQLEDLLNEAIGVLTKA